MRDLVCKQCGITFHRHPTAAYCFPCSQERLKTRIASPHRKRNGIFTARRENGIPVCIDCAIPVHQDVAPNGHKRRPRLRCEQCGRARGLFLELFSGRRAAQSATSIAIKAGRIAHPTSLRCTDCNEWAECYDHRDYGRPLDVQPVCRSCNVMRGHAKPLSPFIVSAVLLAAIAEGALQPIQGGVQNMDPSENSRACHGANPPFFADF